MKEEKEYIKIPLLNMIESMDLIEDRLVSNYKIIYHNNTRKFLDTKKLYAYKIKEDTMKPRICKGDIIIFEKVF